ncbi:phospholipase C [Paraburkholderia diazotrophica]|uniref:Phospholipase C n=1 Tax=Paraburkholderia diazotrophica TaxID=667676 RepID=A0A1H6Z0E3_9BURK|nr:phospholipase C [Paraburkholderia diazotrophica]
MQWRQIALGSLTAAAFASTVAWSASDEHDKNRPDEVHTATPIKHLVVIYGENVSFDHYFATYPHATNPSGEPEFRALPGTPQVNGLSGTLLTNNPNFANTANGTGAANPFRLDRTQASTADQNHAYTAEQQAYDNGAADLFPKYTGKGSSGGAGAFGTTGQVMGYFDGNTITALWNYAQRFAMSDNAYTSTYGPSTPGALEVVSGQTNGMKVVLTTKQPSASGSYYVNDGQDGFTMINDVDPAYDSCSSTTDTALMTGKNIGDLLNARNITWGGFMGGFNLATVNSNGTTGCKRSTLSTVVGSATADYIPHHNWFQYYASTANPKHLRPSSIQAIGHSMQKDSHSADPANHQYDTDDFFNAVNAGNFPAVSFLKAPAFQDGHAGYSDPLDEQAFVTKVVNFLQQQKDWNDTAVIVAWDDSDGWYDHAYAMPTSASYDSVADQLNGAGICGTGSADNGVKGKPVNGRCGPGTRIPFVVISPWAKENFVDHTLIDQSSVARFIEDNWLDGQRIGGGSFDAKAGSIMGMFDFNRRGDGRYQRKLFLDPTTGVQVERPPKI